jgi:PPOX class probable F420-dependent enzyme
VVTDDPVLSAAERAFLSDARRAVLATIAPDGRPRLVPICFVLEPARPVLWTPLDEKPKTVDDVMHLARVRDIRADPRVTVLVDRWAEDWAQLAWLRCSGIASIVEPGISAADRAADRDAAITALRAKQHQYASHVLEVRPIIRIAIERAVSWGALTLP